VGTSAWLLKRIGLYPASAASNIGRPAGGLELSMASVSELDKQPRDLAGKFASQEAEGAEARAEALSGTRVQVPTPERCCDRVGTTGKQSSNETRPDVTRSGHAQTLRSAIVAPHLPVRCCRPYDLAADRHDRAGVRRQSGGGAVRTLRHPAPVLSQALGQLVWVGRQDNSTGQVAHAIDIIGHGGQSERVQDSWRVKAAQGGCGKPCRFLDVGEAGTDENTIHSFPKVAQALRASRRDGAGVGLG
jgi:hypothetical protein